MPVTLDRIQTARSRISKHMYQSPLVFTESLSSLTGNSVYLKLENLQMTGSFKERGALNCLLTLPEDSRRKGVIAASAGNHARGLAWHASRRSIPCEIWMPVLTPMNKIAGTRNCGAEVVLHGNSYDEAYEGALRRSQEGDLALVHAFNDPEVIAGQGTLGLEMLEQNPDLSALLVPVGGGGLIGGVACAVKEVRPDIQVIGVQTALMPSMAEAVSKGSPVTLPSFPTIAEGIAVRTAGERTFGLVQRYVDRIVTVDEEDIAYAILVLVESEKTVAEGAGAAALAALLTGRAGLHNERVGVLISGGNVDVNLLARIIERGLVRDGRRVRVRVRLQDRPGALEHLAATVARQNVNVIETFYNRQHFGVTLGETAIDLTMETRGMDHTRELLDALSADAYDYQVIA